MAPFNFLFKRTGTLQKRPDPNLMALGELNLNYNESAGGLYYKDTTGVVRKVGPTHLGPSAPNSSPAGSTGHSIGEMWFDTLIRDFKIWDGSTWLVASEEGNPVGRMYWDGNLTATTLSPQNSWNQFNTGSRSLGPEFSEFALDTTIVGLRYTGLATRRMAITVRGRFDSSPNTSFRFGVAKTTTGVASPATDLLADSVASLQDSKIGDIYMCETVTIIGPNTVVYPVIQNFSSATSATIKNLSFLVKKI